MNLGTDRFFTKNLLHYIAAIVGALCLLIPAFYNGYPLVNPDTGTYVSSGFLPDMPSDRPITYGVFVRLTTLNGISLWLTVFVQAYIMTWLIFRIIKIAAGERFLVFKGLLTVFILSVCTGLSWIVSQVQPDVFTSVAFLTVILLLIEKRNRRSDIVLKVLLLLLYLQILHH